MIKQHMLSHITTHFIFSLDFFLQSYLFITTTPYHTKVCHLVLWLVRYSVKALGRWGPRHEKLSMRAGTGKVQAQVQAKLQSTADLRVPRLELARSGARAQFTF